MANLVDATRSRLRTADPSPLSLLRMAAVVSSSIAMLVALPGWLRGLEAAGAHAFSERDIPPTLAQPSRPAVDAALAAPSEAKESIARQALADSLGKRYRVSRDALERFIHLAYTAGQITKVDPLLILAVMAVESSFNPIAESIVGAKGLMQIIPEFHQDKLIGPRGRELNALDPEANILAGAKVLREYATRTGEDVVAALRLYGGTGQDPAHPYPSKVLSERDRLQQILRRALDRREVRLAGGAQRL